MTPKNWLRLLVYGGALGLLAWAFWLEPDSLRVREHDLPLARWPAEQNGLRIALLSDIHAGAPYINAAKLQKIVRLTQESRPDLILLAGDFVINSVVGGHYMPPEEIARHLSGLKAPLGVYAVPGNHEHRREPGRMPEMRAAFEKHGIAMIDGKLLKLELGRFRFWLTGYDNLPLGVSQPERQIRPSYADDLPLIALTHDAETYRVLPDQVRSRIRLLLAGHTHGGQVNLPFLGPVMLRLIKQPFYQAGHYREQSDLFITTGIGTSNLPARFRVPPEISMLILKHAHE